VFNVFRRKPAPAPPPIRHPFSVDAETGPVEIEATDDGVRLVGPGGESNLLLWERIACVRLHSRLVDRRFGLPSHMLYCCSLEVAPGSELVFAHALPDLAGGVSVHAASYRLFLKAIHDRLAASNAKPSFETGSPPGADAPPQSIAGGLDAIDDTLDAIDIGARAMETAMHAPWIVGAFMGFALIPVFADHSPWTKLRFHWRNRQAAYNPRSLPKRLLPPI
jgi:hypothetical protein